MVPKPLTMSTFLCKSSFSFFYLQFYICNFLISIPSGFPSITTCEGSSRPYSFANSFGITSVQECCPASHVLITSFLSILSNICNKMGRNLYYLFPIYPYIGMAWEYESAISRMYVCTFLFF